MMVSREQLQQSTTSAGPPAVVRIFVSSTFLDMQAERDELIKYVFPKLRQQFESRGVSWPSVDLRWGVTDEEAAENGVLDVCFTQIDRCRPYFIGMLADRCSTIQMHRSPCALFMAQG